MAAREGEKTEQGAEAPSVEETSDYRVVLIGTSDFTTARPVVLVVDRDFLHHSASVRDEGIGKYIAEHPEHADTPIVVRGLGGAGKTRVAYEYAQQYLRSKHGASPEDEIEIAEDTGVQLGEAPGAQRPLIALDFGAGGTDIVFATGAGDISSTPEDEPAPEAEPDTPVETDDTYYDEVREAVGRGTRSILLGTSTKSLERHLSKLRDARRGREDQLPHRREIAGSFSFHLVGAGFRCLISISPLRH